MLLVAAVTLVLALAMIDRLELLFSLVSFGALSGFLMVHLSVVTHHAWRGRSGRWVAHLAAPTLGFLIVAYVLVNLSRQAQLLGAAWLAVGVGMLVWFKLRGLDVAID